MPLLLSFPLFLSLVFVRQSRLRSSRIRLLLCSCRHSLAYNQGGLPVDFLGVRGMSEGYQVHIETAYFNRDGQLIVTEQSQGTLSSQRPVHGSATCLVSLTLKLQDT